MTQSRFSRLDSEALDPEQRSVFDRIAAGPRGAVPLIFQVLLASPELADRVQHLGARLRYESGLTPRESELVILATARFWKCSYEWEHHERAARVAGLPEAAIAAVHRGDAAGLTPSEALLHAFALAVLTDGDVPDAVFDTVSERYGHATTVNLATLVGYYSMLAVIARAVRLEREDQGHSPARNG
jgi:4-carboxymuconolactone decarboxylase